MQTSPRLFLRSITLSNFKSYGNRTTIDFTSKLNCVVGKNGCGKSALIDAICCGLGVDIRKLRATKYTDLITKLENQSSDKCSILLSFEGVSSQKESLNITFTTDSSGTTTFRYNNKIVSRDLLRQTVYQQINLRTVPEPLFVIQQNRVQSFCCNDSDFLVDFVHETNGCNQFMMYVKSYEKDRDSMMKIIDNTTEELQSKQRQISVMKNSLSLLHQKDELQNTHAELVKELTSYNECLHRYIVHDVKSQLKQLQSRRDIIQMKIDSIQQESDQQRAESLQRQRESERTLRLFHSKIENSEKIVEDVTIQCNASRCQLQEMRQQQEDQEKEKKTGEKSVRDIQCECDVLTDLIHDNITLISLNNYLVNTEYTSTVSASIEKKQKEQEKLTVSLKQLTDDIADNDHRIASINEQITVLTTDISLDEQLRVALCNLAQLRHFVSPQSDFDAHNNGYLGLAVEHLRFTHEAEIFKSCFIQLLKPHLSIHLCKTYNDSKSLLDIAKYRGESIRLWVYEKIRQSYHSDAIRECIRHGTITLVSPMSLCMSSLPLSHVTGTVDASMQCVLTAIVRNTFFLDVTASPLTDEATTASLTAVLAANGVRVIASDGSIHSNGIMSGGSDATNRSDGDMLWTSLKRLQEASEMVTKVGENLKKLRLMEHDVEEAHAANEVLFMRRDENTFKLQEIAGDINDLMEANSANSDDITRIISRFLSIEPTHRDVFKSDLLHTIAKLTIPSLPVLLQHWETKEARAMKCLEQISSTLMNLVLQCTSLEREYTISTADLISVKLSYQQLQAEENMMKEKAKVESSTETTDVETQYAALTEELQNVDISIRVRILLSFITWLYDNQLAEESASYVETNEHTKRRRVNQTDVLSLPEGVTADNLKIRIEEIKSRMSDLSTELYKIELNTKSTKIGMSEKDIKSDEIRYMAQVDKMNQIQKGLTQITQDIEMVNQHVKNLDLQTFSILSTRFANFCKFLIPEKDIKMTLKNTSDVDCGISIDIRNNNGEPWKSSLIELSGGQKSLVSIALILSQVVYNPFPIYIFDEIDAALDEENTTRVVKLINDVIIPMNTQVICISHHTIFRENSTNIISVIIN